MPETNLDVRWPDGNTQHCYSPSLVVREQLAPGASYPLADFLARSRTALNEASERVRQRYGVPCSRAIGQLAEIERQARAFSDDASVIVIAFHDIT